MGEGQKGQWVTYGGVRGRDRGSAVVQMTVFGLCDCVLSECLLKFSR